MLMYIFCIGQHKLHNHDVTDVRVLSPTNYIWSLSASSSQCFGDFTYQLTLYNTLLDSDRLIGCLWSRDIE
jgi:hypothetical protein